ncbi:peptidylprolyl isomerase, partial [Acinetobacter baumannii]
DQMGTPEKRQVEQIVFPTIQEATAARGRLNDSFSFEDLAKERGLNPDDYDLGLIAKSGIIDPTIAAAAFALPSGEISQPVQGQFGVALVKI